MRPTINRAHGTNTCEEQKNKLNCQTEKKEKIIGGQRNISRIGQQLVEGGSLLKDQKRNLS